MTGETLFSPRSSVSYKSWESERSIMFIVSGQGLSSDPVFLVENISEIPQNKLPELKKLLAKSLSKKISVEKVRFRRGPERV